MKTMYSINILVFTLVTIKEAMALPSASDEHIKAMKELMLSSDNLRAETLTPPELDSLKAFRTSLGVLMPPPVHINDETLRNMDSQKAYECSLLQCSLKENLLPVCACNYNTGNVVTFKNECDSKKHNCRFNTAFHVIMNEICPWEFQSRRNKEVTFNYEDPKYYN